MTKKNDKRLCWNCDGNVSHHFSQCPYCGVDLNHPPAEEENPFNQGFASPFQSSGDPVVPQPPYARSQHQDFSVSEEEWKKSLNEEKTPQQEEDASPTTKKEMVALLLLLPGVVFFLFGLALVFFSHDGMLTLKWNQHFAYFYFLGAVPLLYLGWRALR